MILRKDIYMTKNIEAFAEKTKEEKLIFNGKILRLYHDTVTLPDNNSAMREYCRHNGGVGVIPVTDNGDILCVEQYRYPHAKMTLEIPAGKLEAKDCDHRHSALRELREETGAVCDKLIYLGEIYPSPAILDEVIHLYMAEGLHFGERDLDDDEFLECYRIPLDTMFKMVIDGEICDAKTQIAVLKVWAMKNMEDKK